MRGRRCPRFFLVNYDDEVTPLSPNLAGLLCLVAADDDLLCVLAKGMELVGDSMIKSF
jgi:hypothetical protein